MKLSAPIYRLKRQARLLARELAIPLHAALDRIARREGYRGWSHLAGALSGQAPARAIFARLAPADLLLLGARPGQGKTLLGLELAVEAARSGRRSFFFSLEENEAVVRDRLRALGGDTAAIAGTLTIDTSDAICADYIINRLGAGDGGTVAVIDYLQLLDQKRSHPELAVQLDALRRFARTTGATIIAMSQIDRSFDRTGKALPDLSDVRLPNPVDLAIFTKTCFLHDGELLFAAAG
jgi:replicative DNA helicase